MLPTQAAAKEACRSSSKRMHRRFQIRSGPRKAGETGSVSRGQARVPAVAQGLNQAAAKEACSPVPLKDRSRTPAHEIRVRHLRAARIKAALIRAHLIRAASTRVLRVHNPRKNRAKPVLARRRSSTGCKAPKERKACRSNSKRMH